MRSKVYCCDVTVMWFNITCYYALLHTCSTVCRCAQQSRQTQPINKWNCCSWTNYLPSKLNHLQQNYPHLALNEMQLIFARNFRALSQSTGRRPPTLRPLSAWRMWLLLFRSRDRYTLERNMFVEENMIFLQLIFLIEFSSSFHFMAFAATRKRFSKIFAF